MSYISLRCRHTNVTWISSHSCRCKCCDKVGHWFENEGLVMWIRDDENLNEKKETRAIPAAPMVIQRSVANSNEPAVA